MCLNKAALQCFPFSFSWEAPGLVLCCSVQRFPFLKISSIPIFVVGEEDGNPRVELACKPNPADMGLLFVQQLRSS